MRRVPTWLKYILTATLFLVLAIAGFIPWLVGLEIGVWPLAPPKPAGWRAAPASAAIVGCYDVSVANWSPRLSIGGDAVFTTPPRTVEFTSMPSRRRGFVARP